MLEISTAQLVRRYSTDDVVEKNYSDLYERDILNLSVSLMLMTNYYPSTFYQKPSCNIFYPPRCHIM